MGDNSRLLELLDPQFPLVWKGVLPKEGHFQMQKSRLSRECPICERPYTVFYWRLNGIPFRTCICQICAKSKNVCQVSLLDLDTGIPVVVRNKLLHQISTDFKSKTARWYHNRYLDRQINSGEQWFSSSISEQMKMIDPAIIIRIQQLVQADPYLSFRKAAVCQKWLVNECVYGESCFYAHELPKPGEHSLNMEKFGVRGRYLGTVDPNGETIIEQLQVIDPTFFSSKNNEDEENEGKESKVKFQQANVETTEEKPIMTPPPPTPAHEDPRRYLNDRQIPHLINGRLVL